MPSEPSTLPRCLLSGRSPALRQSLAAHGFDAQFSEDSAILVSQLLKALVSERAKSRWLFVWMTFMGAIVALKEHGHLGTDMLVGKLGPAGKKFCLALSYVLMLFICWLLFSGAYQQTMINMDTTSAVMEVSMAWIYAPGVVFAVMGGLILLTELFRLLTGQMRDEDLVMIQESEESPHGADKA